MFIRAGGDRVPGVDHVFRATRYGDLSPRAGFPNAVQRGSRCGPGSDHITPPGFEGFFEEERSPRGATVQIGRLVALCENTASEILFPPPSRPSEESNHEPQRALVSGSRAWQRSPASTRLTGPLRATGRPDGAPGIDLSAQEGPPPGALPRGSPEAIARSRLALPTGEPRRHFCHRQRCFPARSPLQPTTGIQFGSVQLKVMHERARPAVRKARSCDDAWLVGLDPRHARSTARRARRGATCRTGDTSLPSPAQS